MKFIVLFEDAPDAPPDIRKTHMGQHLSFLEGRSTAIEAAGPLSDDDGRGRDGLWVVEAESRDAVKKLIREDPFWPTGLRKSVSILKWTQVYAEGKRLLPPA